MTRHRSGDQSAKTSAKAMPASPSTAQFSRRWPIALSVTVTLAGCTTATRSGDTVTFTHAPWTVLAIAVSLVAALAAAAYLWTSRQRTPAIGLCATAILLAAILGPKHATEFITVSDRGIEARTGAWWWAPETWSVDFANVSEVLIDERRELTSPKSKPEVIVHRSLIFVGKDGSTPMPTVSQPIIGLLRDAKADVEIIRRAKQKGLNTDPASSPHLQRQRTVGDPIRKQPIN